MLYGQPASGKTTLGNLLAGHLETPFIIDGDEFRNMFNNKEYGFGGRKKNIRAANAAATYLTQVDWLCPPVIVCLVNPYDNLRKELKNNNQDQIIEIFLNSKRELRKQYHVEDFEIGNPKYMINTDHELEDTWEQLKGLLKL